MIDDQQEFNIIKNMLKLIYYVPESHLELTKKLSLKLVQVVLAIMSIVLGK
jgi:hypothetical protein